jgi:hypothetical protein
VFSEIDSQMYLEFSLDMQAPDAQGRTPLVSAIYAGNVDMTRALGTVCECVYVCVVWLYGCPMLIWILTHTLSHSSHTHILSHTLTFSLTHSHSLSHTHILSHILTFSLTHTLSHTLSHPPVAMGADVEHTDADGHTPLYHATRAQHNTTRLIQVLYEDGDCALSACCDEVGSACVCVCVCM